MQSTPSRVHFPDFLGYTYLQCLLLGHRTTKKYDMSVKCRPVISKLATGLISMKNTFYCVYKTSLIISQLNLFDSVKAHNWWPQELLAY